MTPNFANIVDPSSTVADVAFFSVGIFCSIDVTKSAVVLDIFPPIKSVRDIERLRKFR